MCTCFISIVIDLREINLLERTGYKSDSHMAFCFPIYLRQPSCRVTLIALPIRGTFDRERDAQWPFRPKKTRSLVRRSQFSQHTGPRCPRRLPLEICIWRICLNTESYFMNLQLKVRFAKWSPAVFANILQWTVDRDVWFLLCNSPSSCHCVSNQKRSPVLTDYESQLASLL